MKALILAAGYATRLYPLTREYPKPLLEVKGRPVIDYLCGKLSRIGRIDQIYVVTNSKFFARFSEWFRGRKYAKKITLVNDLTKSDKTKRGAIGDVNFVIEKKRLKDDLLVIGGDNLFSQPLGSFISFSRLRRPAVTIGAYKLKERKDARRYGVVEINKKGRITDFAEKPAVPRSNLVAMCLYYMPKESLGLVREYMLYSGKSDATGSYISWLKENSEAYGFVFAGSWFDIGDYKHLNAAKDNFT